MIRGALNHRAGSLAAAAPLSETVRLLGVNLPRSAAG